MFFLRHSVVTVNVVDIYVQVSVGDIRSLFKLRIQHDNSNSFPAWHLQSVSICEHQHFVLIIFKTSILKYMGLDNLTCSAFAVNTLTTVTEPYF